MQEFKEKENDYVSGSNKGRICERLQGSVVIKQPYDQGGGFEGSLVGVVFQPLHDIDFFKRFSVKHNTIEWENGADLAPEYLFSLPGAE